MPPGYGSAKKIGTHGYEPAQARQRSRVVTADPFNRLVQEVAAAATVEDANEILSTVSLHELSEDEVAKLIDVARDK